MNGRGDLLLVIVVVVAFMAIFLSGATLLGIAVVRLLRKLNRGLPVGAGGLHAPRAATSPAPLGPGDPIAPGAPGASALEPEAPGPELHQLAERLKSGARWFYWIAALSLVNTVVSAFGGEWGFVVGLGITQFIDGVGKAMRPAGPVVAAILNLAVVAGFLAIGRRAERRSTVGFVVGMSVYALDTLLFVAHQLWVGFAFHVFALACLFMGYRASVELKRRGGAHLATPRARRARRWPAVALVGGLVGLVGLAGLAMVLARGPDLPAPRAGVEQMRPVVVNGLPLPRAPEGPARGAGDPARGRPMPELRGAAFDGTPVAITGDGRAKLVVFVAHWCPPCHDQLDYLQRWMKEGLLAGVQVHAVSTAVEAGNTNYPPSSWIERQGWPLPVLADAAQRPAATAAGAPGLPFFVFVHANGKVAGRHVGFIERAALREWIARLEAPD